MYEMESVDKKSVATYSQKLMETIEDEYSCLKISSVEERGDTVYKVDSGYEGAEETSMEISTEDADSIGCYLEGRINEGMDDIEVAYVDERYTVSVINSE